MARSTENNGRANRAEKQHGKELSTM